MAARKNRQVDIAAVWSEPAPRRPPLTREQVVREALALLDDVGFDGLTMRRLAQRIGVQAASLYNHVHDKHELLTLLADTISGELRDPDPNRPWREQLEAAAREYRRVLLKHRDGARVLAATPPVGPKRVRAIEQLLAVLQKAGFSHDDIADAGFVFNSFVTGFVLDETQSDQSTETRAQIDQWFSSLPVERYPTVVSLANQLANPDTSRRFEFGLQLMLDGLEQRRRRR